jgi:hypothetical protein
MKQLKTIIESCKKCQHFKSERDYTSDSFDFCLKWFCNLENKDIRRYVDTWDKQKFIPDWCPLDNYIENEIKLYEITGTIELIDNQFDTYYKLIVAENEEQALEKFSIYTNGVNIVGDLIIVEVEEIDGFKINLERVSE